MNIKNRRNSKKQITGMKRKLSRKSILNMVGGMIVNVANFNTKQNITIDVSQYELIEYVKEVVSNIINIRNQFLRLIFKGKMLEDGRTLADYNINRNDTIILVFRKMQCPLCRFEEQIDSLHDDPRFKVEPFDEPIVRRIKETEHLRVQMNLRDKLNDDCQMYPMCTEHSDPDVDDAFIMRKFDILDVKVNTEKTSE